MKNKNYKCCGKNYKKLNQNKFNFKCLKCKKNKNNKNLKCNCDWYKFNQSHKAKIMRTNTMYENEAENYIICCNHFYKNINDMFQELWDDFYSSRL